MAISRFLLGLEANVLRTILLALGCLTVAMEGAYGQGNPSPSYEQCALRIEVTGGLFSRRTIVRGIGGQKVARIGFFSAPDLRALFSVSDSSTYYFDQFRSNHGSGNIMRAAGNILVGLAAVLFNEFDGDGAQVALVAGGLGGFALYLVGDERSDRARNSLARAVWWYNCEFAR